MSRQRISRMGTVPAGDGFTALVHTSEAETSVTYTVAVPAAKIAAVKAAGGDVDAVTGMMPVVCTTKGGVDATLTCTGNGCTCA
jgi:hypothetical protein